MNTAFRLAIAGLATLFAYPAFSDVPARERRALGAESRPATRSATAPQPLAVGAVSHLLLPTSANANGAYGAVYKTKVSVFNAVDTA